MYRANQLPGASADPNARMGTPEGGAPLIDFMFLLRVLRRRLSLIVLVCLLCVAAGTLFQAVTAPRYASTASVILDTPAVVPFGSDAVFAQQNQNNPAVVESQLQLIRSPYLLSQVVSNLSLDERGEFMEPYETRFESTIKRYANELLDMMRETGVFPAASPAATAEISPELRFEEAVQKLRDGLEVSRNGLTLVLTVRYTSSYANLSAEIATAIAQAYVEDRQQSRSSSAIKASDWFDDRIAELNERAVQAEAAAARFRADNQIINAGREGLVSEQQVSTVAQDLNLASQARLEAKATLDRLTSLTTSGAMPIPLPDNLSTETLRDLNARFAILSTERERFAAQYGADHAATVDMDSQLAAVQARMRAEVEQMVLSATADYSAAETRERDAQTAFDAVMAQANGVEGSQVQLRALESEAQVYRQLHDSYLESFMQTMQQQSFPTIDARVIAEGNAADFPSGPSLRWTVIAASIIGLALGTGIAFTVESVDRRLRSRIKFADAIGAPVLGILPAASQNESRGATKLSVTKPKRLPPSQLEGKLILPSSRQSLRLSERDMSLTIDRPLSTYGETIRRVKVAADAMGGQGGSVVGFVSDQPTSRRSTVAINYAEMLALGGSRTILLDADWHDMFLTVTVSPNAAYGLADILVPDNTVPPEAVFWYDERTGLSFLPNRGTGDRVSVDPGVFDLDRMRDFLRQLASRFDNVIIDFSNLADSADAAAYAQEMTGYVVVAIWGETDATALSGEIARSGIPRDKIIGGVLDGATLEQMKQYETFD